MDSLVDFLINFYGPTPYLIIFGILLACGMGLPFPEDVTLFAAGLLAYYGLTNLSLTIAVAFLGVVLGDLAIFSFGTVYGSKITKKWFFSRILPEDRLKAVRRRFRKRGNKLIFAARFMPGLRAPIFFSAGSLHLPFRVFILYDGLAAAISVPVVIGAVYYFGDQLDQLVRVVKRVEHGIVFVVALVVLMIGAKWYITHRKLQKTPGEC